MLRLANLRSGLVYPHDSVCYFQSQYGHHMSLGYFNDDAMPLDAVIHLLRGGQIRIIDATRHKGKALSDALKFGVPTWCAVFNRAIRIPLHPCVWFTKDMFRASRQHRRLVRTYRKLASLYGHEYPACIGANVLLECHNGVAHDDKEEEIRKCLA